jgi:simple sugar transport system substrate-binding protein
VTTSSSGPGRRGDPHQALQLAGQLGTREVVFPGVLVTRAFLVKEQIKDMGQLRAKLPELNLTKISSAPWIRSATF